MSVSKTQGNSPVVFGEMPLSPSGIQLSSLLELRPSIAALKAGQHGAWENATPSPLRLKTFAQRSSVEVTSKPSSRTSERRTLPPASTGSAALNRKESNPQFVWAESQFRRNLNLGINTPAAGTFTSTQTATVVTPHPARKAALGKVVVDGVSIPRFQPQETISKRYTEADLVRLGINASNTRVYVIDDFVNPTTPAGAGPTAVKTPHGEITAGIVTATLRGKGEVTRLNAAKVGKPDSWDDSVIAQHINQVIAAEAKRQNKTSSTVDLSNITINLSCGFKSEEPEISRAVAAFTARGGAFFSGAGNEYYSAGAAKFKNASLVDGSNALIGGNIPKVQTPWSSYKNGGVSDSGKDVRANREQDASSQSIIAPSKLQTRVVNGAIEFRDSMSATGWSQLVKASRTTAAPTPTTTSDGLVGLKPQKYVTGKALKDYQEWQFKTYEEAIKNSKTKGAEVPSDLSAEELRAVDSKVAAERKARIGDKPVMSIEEYLKFTGDRQDSKLAQAVIAGIPDGLTSNDVVVSAIQVLDNKRADKFELQYFVRNANTGRLQTIQPLTNMTNGTSWATPVAAASHAIWQREQVAAAKARQRV
jgi:hypothetical protein